MDEPPKDTGHHGWHGTLAGMPALLTWWAADLALLAPRADRAAVRAAAEDLIARWREPHRRYHATRHLAEVLRALRQLQDAGEIDARAALPGRVAGWFHDAVYDPAAPAAANEHASAALAWRVLGDLGVDPADATTVVDLVRRTADHELPAPEPPGRRTRSAFHDADLWILSAEPARFDEYCTQVRREYAHVPDAAYRQGRGAILRSLAGRPRCYATDHAREQWEPAARANLGRELARLAVSGL